MLESLGHHVEPATLPVNGLHLAEDFLLSWFCTQALIVSSIQDMTGAKLRDFETDTRLMAAIGRSVSAVELLKSEARWNEHNRALSQFHAQYDCWLSPTMSAPPLAIGAMNTPWTLNLLSNVVARLGLAGAIRQTPSFKNTVVQNLGWTPYTQLANLTGRPAMSVPLYWTPEGLPLGVQFVGGLNSEALLLQLAAQLEGARPWFGRRPSANPVPLQP